MNHIRFWAVLALAVSVLAGPKSALAQEARHSVAQKNEAEITLKLWYTHRRWKDVLASFAEATGRELIMPHAPKGRWNYHSRNEVNATEALQIINHALDETGFQAKHQGSYLIVMSKEDLRPEYPSQELAETSAQYPQATMKSKEQTPSTSMPEVAPAIQTTAYEETPPPTERKIEALGVEPRFMTALDLAKALHTVYGDHSQLIDEGPMGLPAFAVNVPQPEEKKPIQFTVGIDEAKNRLIVVADAETQRQLVDVMNVLDGTADPTRKDDGSEIVFAPPGIQKAVGKQLPEILAQIKSDQENSVPNNPTSPNAMQEDGINEQTLDEILDQIRGDVSIEALNDLGLLILRGNTADVDSVMQIVRAIEAKSRGTTPEIHLRFLKQVNSESLSTLLNSVYDAIQETDQRASRQNRPVEVIPVVQPNSVIIVAPAQDLESINALIDELDREIDPRQSLRVFRLKHAPSAVARTVIEEFYEERPGLGTRLRITADTRTNTLIIQADPRDLEEIRTLIRDLDRPDSHAVSQLALIPLKNAVAEELAEFINEALDAAMQPRTNVQGNAGQGNNQQQSKSFILEFLAGAGSKADLIRSGVLEDIRISADPRSNQLAIIAPEQSLPLLKSLIETLDQPAEAEAEIKAFTLIQADAATTLELLQELFDQQDAESAVGVNLAGTEDAGSSLLPIRFSVDVRSNTIFAVGGRDALTVVEAILMRLDQATPKRRITQVVELRNIAATEAADAINSFLESQRELSEIDPELVSTYELLEREVIVVPETLTNNLLISATPQYFAEIMAVIEQLDCDPAQVIIQAMLVEVELDNVDEFGVELGFQDSILFDRSVIDNLLTVTQTTTNQNIQTTTQQIVSQEGAPGFLFNNPSLFPNLGNNTGPASQPNLVGTQGLANFGVGRVNGDLGFGGLVLSASSEAVSVLIRALAQQRNVQVLSRPQIRTVDSQLAQIQVGQEVPIINGVNITANGVANPNIEYDEAGIILSVTPRVKPDGQIVMEVVAERSAFQADGVTIFVDATTGNTISSPIKNISVARATVGVGDGQTIVLGGMISKTEETVIRKVPWLGDIPILGRAFRYDFDSNIRSELLIFLTPRIIHGDHTDEMIKEVEVGRIHFFREEFEKLHGPIFGVPANGEIIEEVMPEEIMEGPEVPLELAPPPASPADNGQGDVIDEANVPRTMIPPNNFRPMSARAKQQGSGRVQLAK